MLHMTVSHAFVKEATLLGVTKDGALAVIAWGDRLGETGRAVLPAGSLTMRGPSRRR